MRKLTRREVWELVATAAGILLAVGGAFAAGIAVQFQFTLIH